MSSWRPICAQNSQLMGESAQAPVDEGRTAGCKVPQGENAPLVQGRGALWTSWEWAGRMGSESESWCMQVSPENGEHKDPLAGESAGPRGTDHRDTDAVGSPVTRGTVMGKMTAALHPSRLPVLQRPCAAPAASMGGSPAKVSGATLDPPLTSDGCGRPARLQDHPAHLCTGSDNNAIVFSP